MTTPEGKAALPENSISDATMAMPDWERRYRAARVGLPQWALDNPDHCAVVASSTGVLEVHSFNAATGELTQATSRREGTVGCQIEPSGENLWWFDDVDGSEHGIWRRHPFGTEPSHQDPPATPLYAAYPAGLALGRDGLTVIGRTDDGYGTQIHVCTPHADPRLLYAHVEDAWVGALSDDGTLVAIGHSEHQDSRHPAARVLRVADGSVVGDLWDGVGLGVEPIAFAPAPGDSRLLVRHERHGRGELLIWDVLTGEQTEVHLDLPGEVADASWYADAASLLVAMDFEARARLYRVGLVTGTATPVGPIDGNVLDACTRTGNDVWMLWSSSAVPPAVRSAQGALVLAAPGAAAPGSVPVEDVWVEGPGGRIHALLRRPSGHGNQALPLLVDIHGGPTAHDTDAFRAYPAAWVDHGYAVVQVNYRGSTGYGSDWRDALDKRVGHTELEDIVAVRDHLVAIGVADPERVVIGGASWGGYLTLLALGTYPDRWAVGLAGVPVADYIAAYEDEMEGLKAFDRALFGGSPNEVPHKYTDSSPLTYIDQVRAPVLVLAGENDPRCPIRQIENYLTALRARNHPHEVYRYEAGHGSLVDDERVRQTWAELDFAARHLPRPRL